MTINHDDVMELKKVFDDRYVMQDECSNIQMHNNKKFSNDDKRIEALSRDFKSIKWLITTIATSSIGILVATIFELILK